MAVPLTRGKPYYATFSATLSPTENGTVTTNVGKKYSFSPGNTVIISRDVNSLLRFEGIVDSYDSSTGSMSIKEITNIKTGGGGTWPQTGTFNISLGGQRGSLISSGTGAPSSSIGRSGDMYIDSTTGQVYIKS